MPPFVLNSDRHFIRRCTGTGSYESIAVYEYDGNQNVSDILHISRWKHVCSIYESAFIGWKSLVVHGVKFTSSTGEYGSLVSDLTLAGQNGGRAYELTVNRNGVCFVNVSEKEWVRASDRLFSWAKHGVKIPKDPLGSAIWSVLGRVNGAVSGLLDDVGEEEFSSLRKRSRKLMEENDKLKEESSKLKEESGKLKEETVSFLKRSVVEKEKEVGYFKSDLKEKEEELVSIKVALNELLDK